MPSDLFQQTSLDPIWLYGVCLLALVVLVVVILMLITILAKRTIKTKTLDLTSLSKPQTNPIHRTCQLALEEEDDDDHSSTLYNEATSSQTITSVTNNQNTNPLPTVQYSSSPRISYFNSAFETILKQHLHDDEPIPFIDDNLSVTHSRKSSACWSDRTSLSSRFSLAKKFNFIRSNSQLRPMTPSHELPNGTRRFQYRTIRYVIPPSTRQLQCHEHL